MKKELIEAACNAITELRVMIPQYKSKGISVGLVFQQGVELFLERFRTTNIPFVSFFAVAVESEDELLEIEGKHLRYLSPQEINYNDESSCSVAKFSTFLEAEKARLFYISIYSVLYSNCETYLVLFDENGGLKLIQSPAIE